jgi:predicted nucleic acid-binding protein
VKRFVLDASITLAWFVDRPIAPYANHVKRLLLDGSRAVVPALWHLEVANGFLTAEKRRILTPSDTTEALRVLGIILTQAIESSRDPVSMHRVTSLARQFQLTAYDASYLDAARGLQLPLATLDQRLAKAASQAGIELVP